MNRPCLEKKLRTKPWIPDKSQTILFKNASLVDANTGLLCPNTDVLVKEGLVAAMRADVKADHDERSYVWVNSYLDDLQNSEKESVKVVDLEGKFLCPGLIDCHVHVTAVPGVKTMSEAVSDYSFQTAIYSMDDSGIINI